MLIALAIVGLLVIAGIVMVNATTSQETPTQKSCGSCNGSCTSGSGCGQATCGATAGGTCGCGRQ